MESSQEILQLDSFLADVKAIEGYWGRHPNAINLFAKFKRSYSDINLVVYHEFDTNPSFRITDPCWDKDYSAETNNVQQSRLGSDIYDSLKKFLELYEKKPFPDI